MTLSIIHILPHEVLALILNECKDSETSPIYSRLRLVCKDFNEIVGSHVFSNMVVTFLPGSETRMRDMISYLASGQNTHARWTKNLEFAGVGGISSRELENMAYSIKSMVNLESVVGLFVDVAVDDLWLSVFSSLRELPYLRYVNLILPGSPLSGGNVPLEMFSNLHAITLRYMYSLPSFTDSAKKMISQSPSLEELDIAGLIVDSKESIDLTTFVEDAIHSSSFTPTLKSLTVVQDLVSLTPSCIPFLRALTHLCIHGEDAAVHSPFWEALKGVGIQLLNLRVHHVDQPLVDYLKSYSGIQVLSLNQRKTVGDAEIFHQIFSDVLPEHQATLRSLSFDIRGVGPWCITEDSLKQILLCHNLRKLYMMYYFPASNEVAVLKTVALGEIFSSISQKLPHLQRVDLNFTRKFLRSFSRDRKYQIGVEKFFVYNLSKVVFQSGKSGRVPQFTISSLKVSFRPVADTNASTSGQYRLELVEDRSNFHLAKLPASGVIEDCIV